MVVISLAIAAKEVSIQDDIHSRVATIQVNMVFILSFYSHKVAKILNIGYWKQTNVCYSLQTCWRLVLKKEVLR